MLQLLYNLPLSFLVTVPFLSYMTYRDLKTRLLPIWLTYSFVLCAFIISIIAMGTISILQISYMILSAVSMYMICIWLNNKNHMGKADTKVLVGIVLCSGFIIGFYTLTLSFLLLAAWKLISKRQVREAHILFISLSYYFLLISSFLS